MERINLYLGLGSNLGDRDVNLLKAVNLLDEAFGMHPERISRIVETPAWGFDGPDFLNLCVLYRLPRTGTPAEQATQILHRVKAVEKALGRVQEPLFDAEGRRLYHNRTIDIDILLYGRLQLNSDVLTLPHPLMKERDFVRIPLAEIISDELAAWWTSLR